VSFRGSFEHLIDQKGRVSVPIRFREIVQASGRSEIIVTKCPHNPPPRLEAYPLPQWERFQEAFLKLNRFDRDVMRLDDFYNGNAHVCEIDAQGRILLPPPLRDWAGITKEVWFSGAADRFRLWSREAWQQQQQDAEAAFKTTPEFLGKLAI
jgi:MraZ protein